MQNQEYFITKMSDSASKTFSARKAHYGNYLFGVLFYIAPAVLAFCYAVNHRSELEGIAILIVFLLLWISFGIYLCYFPWKHRSDTITVSPAGLSFAGAYLCGNGNRLGLGIFQKCLNRSFTWNEIAWIKYTCQNNAKWPNALFIKIKTGEVFYITFSCYSNSKSIIREINLYKECEWGRTKEEKAFKNPEIMED